MLTRPTRHVVLAACTAATLVGTARPSVPQSPGPLIVDHTVAPGRNYDKAEFRLWLPDPIGSVRAAVILVPGSNGDGRDMVLDPSWQAFASRHRLALVGCRFTDRPHDQGFIEEYVNVSGGSGQALLDALSELATRSRHPELASTPLLLWGVSAGGQFNYEFVAWRPDRVVAFVVNKGGIYYSALLPAAARQVPGILFAGGQDLAFRTNTIVGLFAVNRRAGALWALAEEPSAAHVFERSREMTLVFFDEVLPLRLPPPATAGGAAGPLRPLSGQSGFIGDLAARTFMPAFAAGTPTRPTSWLPTDRAARAWQALTTDQPLSAVLR